MREQQIQSSIVRYLKAKQCYCVVTTQVTPEGCPDIIGALPNGQFFAVEVKRPNEKPRPIQEYQIEQIKKANGLAIVATGLDDVKKLI